ARARAGGRGVGRDVIGTVEKESPRQLFTGGARWRTQLDEYRTFWAEGGRVEIGPLTALVAVDEPAKPMSDDASASGMASRRALDRLVRRDVAGGRPPMTAAAPSRDVG
ncbi:MAG: hypothetical protein ACOZNI_07860, partial [Myxococcota bacterium]